jgi:putative transposase
MSLPWNAEPRLGKNDEDTKLGLGFPRWYSRGYLPHFDSKEKFQSITFRLADSLPQKKLKQLEEQLELTPDDKRDLEKRKTIEQWLDSGMGCCALNHLEAAELVQETLLQFDGDRYRLLAWCVMPNHVHVLIEPNVKLGKIVQSWKSYTGRWAMRNNAKLGLGVPGKQFWMREYWDRFIRNESHLEGVIAYIHQNPVSAGLCRTPEQWRWSSAYSGNAEPRLGN